MCLIITSPPPPSFRSGEWSADRVTLALPPGMPRAIISLIDSPLHSWRWPRPSVRRKYLPLVLPWFRDRTRSHETNPKVCRQVRLAWNLGVVGRPMYGSKRLFVRKSIYCGTWRLFFRARPWSSMYVYCQYYRTGLRELPGLPVY